MMSPRPHWAFALKSFKKVPCMYYCIVLEGHKMPMNVISMYIVLMCCDLRFVLLKKRNVGLSGVFILIVRIWNICNENSTTNIDLMNCCNFFPFIKTHCGLAAAAQGFSHTYYIVQSLFVRTLMCTVELEKKSSFHSFLWIRGILKSQSNGTKLPGRWRWLGSAI